MTDMMESTVELRRMLHTIPEPAFEEVRTKAALMEFCRQTAELESALTEPEEEMSEAAMSPEAQKAGHFQVTDRGSWFYCVWRGSSLTRSGESGPISEMNMGPVQTAKAETDTPGAVAFRADFDAVTGGDGCFGHFCGHDGHSAALAGFGRKLALEIRPKRDIYLIFQPAEEIGKGAQLCRALLEEADISEIYGFHNIPGEEAGTVLLLPETFACASTGVEITVTGTPAHAAYPQQGKNPSAILAEVILYMNQEVNRPHHGVLLGTVIGAEIGSAAYGVSASKGVLRLTLRGEFQAEYDAFVQSVTGKARAMSAEQGMTCEIRYVEPFPATENTPGCVEKVRRAAEAAGIATRTPEEPFRWSEDFGYYLQVCPGAFFGIGSGQNHPGLHTSAYEFPDEIISTVWTVYKGLSQLEKTPTSTGGE